MDTSLSNLLAGLLVSTVGFSVFLYGKKQARPPQLIVGALLMALPFLVTGALWLAAAAAGLVAGLWAAVRAGH